MKEIYPIVDIYQVSNISSDLFVQNVIIIANKNINPISNQKLIENSQLEEVVITNSIPREHKSKKIKEISVAELFAKTIKAVMEKKSISTNFIC